MRHKILKIIRALCFLPFIAVFLYAVYNAEAGMTFIFTPLEGWDAFFMTLILLGGGFWPVFLGCFVAIVVITVIIKKKEKERAKNYAELK